MQSLRRHEAFEIEVLDKMHRAGFLRPLVFGGGTMLRLCHELPRYSVDLDFWFCKKEKYGIFYQRLLEFFKSAYDVSDAKDKHFTLLYEIRSRAFERKLKIEIRKQVLTRGIEKKIAYSAFASKQVLIQALSLEEMAQRKILAILGRNEMRDFYDLEFLLRKGVPVRLSEKEKSAVLQKAGHFTRKDFGTVLGSLVERQTREYYARNGFSYLLESSAFDISKKVRYSY